VARLSTGVTPYRNEGAQLLEAEAERRVALAYARVGEYQKRGLVHVHVHALVRLDRAMPDCRKDEIRRPSARFTVEVLEQAVRSAVTEVRAKGSKYLGSPRVRWGEELDVRALSDAGGRRARPPATSPSTPRRAPSRPAGCCTASRPLRSRPFGCGRMCGRTCAPRSSCTRRPSRTPTRCAARTPPPRTRRASTRPPPAAATPTSSPSALARRSPATSGSASASVESAATVAPRITACGDAELRDGTALELTLHTGERIHLAAVARIAHATPRLRDRHDPRLAACAHQFGHRGQCLTKSRRYSTTLTALRQARHEHAARTHEQHAEVRSGGQLALGAEQPRMRISALRYVGQGHLTAADALLAASAAARAREQRRAARESLEMAAIDDHRTGGRTHADRRCPDDRSDGGRAPGDRAADDCR
jgi:hypothetical protein